MKADDLYFGFDGQPIDLMTWSDLFSDYPGRLVSRDRDVITVWFGTDMRGVIHEHDRPLIYGTQRPDGSERFYATREEALAGHAEEVQAAETAD